METESVAKEDGRRSIASRLIEELNNANVEVFLDHDAKPYATIPVRDHYETWPLHSRVCKDFLMKCAYESLEVVVPKQTLDLVLDQLRANATYGGPERQTTYLRVAAVGDRIYLDLTDEEWRAVEIDKRGWRVVSDPPVKFVRVPQARALPVPKRGGDISSLKELIPFRSEDDFVLAVAFLLSALRQKGPHFVATIIGKQGTGKTESSLILKNLIDPADAAEMGAPKKEEDLWIRAQHQHVVFFGNLRRLREEMSDALARLATGGGFATRELYTNGDLFVLRAERPMLLNSIFNFIEQPDLADRCLFLELEGFDTGGATRLDRDELNRRFNELAPLVLGALCEGVAGALRTGAEGIEVPDTRMMAALGFAIAAESSLGFSPGTIADAYQAHVSRRRERLLEGLPVIEF